MQKRILGISVAGLVVFASAALAAEDTASRMDRIERRMMALEHQTFGSSKGEAGASGDAADVEARLGVMEEENAKLYGSVEELGKAVENLAKKIDLIVKDMDLRLQDLEKKSKAQ